ncbi:MAG: 23S rRNA (adenine(2503)-C(2))-methyltransferase RlmN [Planctomycetes bacterium]|nr:23S rRNA (adenine(2503)-C(2))-methyltransferase RlmN [Planctomycetota bacterium]MCP4838010.1 23S rRNA (adenine(2503)-C(2))-methyltransferase RlmN [Planctomycetota bacterium]
MPHPDLLLGSTLEGWVRLDDAPHGAEAADIYRRYFRHGSHAAVPGDGRVITSTLEDDGTTKFLLKHTDGAETESVIMPIKGRSGRIRHTLCLSSQVGCAMGCTFCQTATMGRVRQLTAAEIIAQWHHATHVLGAAITNVVFMGMGEPMDNLAAVLTSIEVLVDHNAAAIPPSRVGLSTVGHAEGIRQFTRFMQRPGMHQVRLAVSVNAADEETRSSIMPITRAVSMTALRDSMQEWIEAGGRPILIEYVLIPGVNDHPDAPDMLAEWLSDLPCRVNVIPYNPKVDSPWPAPDEQDVKAFIDAVSLRGLPVNRRRTMGRGVMAACGQLGVS